MSTRSRKVLTVLLLAYGVASLAHNAQFLADYPNLPAWLTRAQVYGVLLGVTAVGVLGYLLTRATYEVVGLGVLAVYAALGLDGLAHYSRAPITAHTTAMNLTIWVEVVAATLVLITIAGVLGERFRVSQRDA